MDLTFVVIALVVLAGAVMYFGNRQKAAAAAKPAGEVSGGSTPQEANEPPVKALQRAGAGDAVVFWDGADALIESVLECSETVNARTTNWRWLVLDNGGLLELAPDGNSYYPENMVFHQGGEEFEIFTGEAEDGGILKTFEERVRAGRSAREPVIFEYHENNWQLRSTGVFSARPQGEAPAREVWRDVSDDPSQNVYFEMTTASGGRAVGVWTSHILFVVGRPLVDNDIRGVYRR